MKFSLFAASILALAFQAHALSTLPEPRVAVTNAWVKTTVPGGRVSAAYMTIEASEAIKLIKVEAESAGIVEIHDMKMNDGVMEMKALDEIVIPADAPVTLKPGGMHVMLLKIKKPINKGDKVPLILTFQTTGRGASDKTFTERLGVLAREKAPGAELKKP